MRPADDGLEQRLETMNNLVDKMEPAGSTNQPIGFVWGWMSLAGGGALTVPTKTKEYTYKDVIIILSDGLNTQDRWYGNGSDVLPKSTPACTRRRRVGNLQEHQGHRHHDIHGACEYRR